jgi:hypothetical protein
MFSSILIMRTEGNFCLAQWHRHHHYLFIILLLTWIIPALSRLTSISALVKLSGTWWVFLNEESISPPMTLYHTQKLKIHKQPTGILSFHSFNDKLRVKFFRYRPSRPLGTRTVKASGFSRLSALWRW